MHILDIAPENWKSTFKLAWPRLIEDKYTVGHLWIACIRIPLNFCLNLDSTETDVPEEDEDGNSIIMGDWAWLVPEAMSL
jgi:hypothetical protein